MNAGVLGLGALERLGSREDGLRVVHAADISEAFELLGQRAFRALLYPYRFPQDRARLKRLLQKREEFSTERGVQVPLICVVRNGDDRTLAKIVSKAEYAGLFAEQLERPEVNLLLEALLERIEQKMFLQGAQKQLIHSEKFAAMGVLAAEIAHEINNPASFVISNLSVMIDYVQSVGAFMDDADEVMGREAPRLQAQIAELSTRYDIEYLREDLDELLRRSLNGMQRIHQIVQDLRFFSHDAGPEPAWVCLDGLLETTVSLVRYEAKGRARFILDFGGDCEIYSDANRLSQVFLNLLLNAIHAIEPGQVEENSVTVSTRREHKVAVVTITDTGSGMSQAVLRQIFEPFFTTKERGGGSGLGLSLSYDIIHSLGGQILVSSELGAGSTFELRLPVEAAEFRSYIEAPIELDEDDEGWVVSSLGEPDATRGDEPQEEP